MHLPLRRFPLARLASALFPALVALAACQGAAATSRPPPTSGELTAAALDTLQSPRGYAVGKPLWISRDRSGRFVVADESDKALKLFTAHGAAAGSVGRPGAGPGEFTALLGGGTLGDSLYAYDFNGGRFTVFTPAGRFARSLALTGPGRPMPASVRVVDDSLLLVVGFPTGSHTRELVRLVGRDGTARSAFFNLRRYFTPENADLVQASVAYGDAAGGTVFVGLMGLDSVYAFDYAGRRLGAGRIPGSGGARLPTFRALIEANGGRRFRPDRSLVYEHRPALVALASLDAAHAVLQVMPLEYGGAGRLDRTEGGTFLLASLDRATGTITTGPAREMEGGITGRDGHGSVLVARYLGEDFERIELVRLGRAPARETAP